MEMAQAYRTLGIHESATYDEIDTRLTELKAIYASDVTKLEEFQRARDTISDIILRQRMSGSLKAKYTGPVAREDRPKPKRPPPWTGLLKLFQFPSRSHLVRVLSVLIGFSVAS